MARSWTRHHTSRAPNHRDQTNPDSRLSDYAATAAKGGAEGLSLATAVIDATCASDAGLWKIVFLWLQNFTPVCPTSATAKREPD